MGGNSTANNGRSTGLPANQRIKNLSQQGENRSDFGGQQGSRANMAPEAGRRDVPAAREQQASRMAPGDTLAMRESMKRQPSSKFVPDMGEMASGEVMEAVVGGVPGDGFGMSPFRAGTDKRRFLETRKSETPEVPGSDSSVKQQQFAPMVGGGEPGIGLQGFGSRALVGGEAEVVSPEDVQSMDQPVDGVMAEVAQSDVGRDPNYVEPGPGKAIIGQQAYNLPVTEDALAFIPGTREAMRFARGPVSRNLMEQRKGFGRKM